MKEIKLNNGRVALVDDEYYEFLSQFHWWARFDGYNWYAEAKLKGVTVSMHRMVMMFDNPSLDIDHIDHNGLNNQKSNLRFCSHRQNSRNMGFRKKTNQSGFKGVSWKPHIRRWISQIKLGEQVVHLGTFSSKKDAAMAYDAAATQHFGEFASTNKSLGILKYEGDPISPRSPFRTCNTSGLLGVNFVKHTNRWHSRLTTPEGRLHLGFFITKKEAAIAYDDAVLKHFGTTKPTNKSLGLI